MELKTKFNMVQSKSVAIIQSSYIPWRGFFNIIKSVDEFILYDDVQFTKRDWRSRNLIKTPMGSHWLSIPINVKGKYLQKINEAQVSHGKWAKGHWKSIETNYKKAPYFESYCHDFNKAYSEVADLKLLSHINYLFINLICHLLNITTKISWSTDYKAIGSKTERLVSLCLQSNATRYLSGPSAKNYIEPQLFQENNIILDYVNYENYSSYPQLYENFLPNVTILDLIFNTGPNFCKYMQS